jgi:hypothetical protein
MVGDPLEYFLFGGPVECMVPVTILNHKAEVSDCARFVDEHFQLGE